MTTAADVRPDCPVALLRGSDPVLVAEAALVVIERLVGEADAGLVVDELGPEVLRPADGTPSLGPLVDAAQTLPFLTDRRVVVGRGLGAFTTKDQVASLVAYLDDPLPTTALVLVWDKPADAAKAGTPPRSLVEAVTAAGGVVVEVGPGRKVGDWVRQELRSAPVSLDAAATSLVVDHVGEDAARLPAVVGALVGAHGAGASLGVDDVAPYLGEAGDVAPWDLTDAVDAGDVAGALAVLERMLVGGGRHPLQVLATLHRHWSQMMALDGAGVGDERAAAQLLGLKGSTFPARKALEQSRRLGSERLADGMALLARADLDLKGARTFGPDAATAGATVMEVLVARLASRAPGRGRSRAGGRRR